MFLGGAFVLRDNEHVAFDIVWNAARPSGRRVMGIVAALGFGGLFLAALPSTLSYIAFLWRERTTVLECGWTGCTRALRCSSCRSSCASVPAWCACLVRAGATKSANDRVCMTKSPPNPAGAAIALSCEPGCLP